MKYITLPQQIVDKALEALDFYADIEGKDYREAFKEAQKYKFDFPKPPFLAKKSRRGIRAYLEPDKQSYHQRKNALEVLKAFQLAQEEEDN
jgi:hypothetical protein